MTRILRVVHVATALGGAEQRRVHGRPQRSALQLERDLRLLRCEQRGRVSPGRSTAFATIIRGPLVRKLVWLVGGMLLLWAINLGRLTLVFWAGRALRRAFRHQCAPPLHRAVTFTLGVAVMILCIRPMGLRIGNVGRGAAGGEAGSAAPRPGSRTGTQAERGSAQGLPGRVAGAGARHRRRCEQRRLAAVQLGGGRLGDTQGHLLHQRPGDPGRLDERYEATFQWAAPLFGEQSVWNRYELYPGVGGDLQARTQVIADVIDTPDLQTFAAFGVEQCYQFHGYSLANVSQVNLPGGITGQSLAYTSQQFGSWTIVYWILPVKRGAGTVYERVVLYVQNKNGLIAQATRGHRTGTGNPAGALSSNGSKQVVLLQNRDFLVAYAREMIRDQASRSAALFAGRTVA